MARSRFKTAKQEKALSTCGRWRWFIWIMKYVKVLLCCCSVLLWLLREPWYHGGKLNWIVFIVIITFFREQNLVTPSKKLSFSSLIISFIIIITRPKAAYGRQGLAGSWGQDTDEVSTILVLLTSHFAPAALRSDLNQPVTKNDNKNPPGIVKTRPGAINNMKNHLQP